MPYLLNFFYVLLLIAASPWLIWSAVRKGKYREGYAEKFLGLIPRRTSDKKCLWLHAVSVGEVNLLAPLLRAIEREEPDWECVISTTTMTGMALARKKYAGRIVFYCPLDFTWAVNAAMRRIRPDVLVLAELELWPNLVWAARRHAVRTAVINGRLSQKSFRGYQRFEALVSRVLSQIDLLAVQDETYAERFRGLGAPPHAVHVTGSMKYDGAQTDRGNPATGRLAALAGFSENDIVFLAGSTQEPEESIALDVFRRLSPDWPQLRLVIVPRHPERFDSVAHMLDASGIAWQRRTELGAGSREPEAGRREQGAGSQKQGAGSQKQGAGSQKQGAGSQKQGAGSQKQGAGSQKQGAGSTEQGTGRPMLYSRLPAPCSVLLVDSVGELGAWWGTARIAFVGGSLGSRGGQNMIEPAAYGAAVSFGPNTRNFRDIVAALLEREAAVVVADGEELYSFVRACLLDPAAAGSRGQRAAELVREQLGATSRTLELLHPLVAAAGTAGVQRRDAA